MARSSKACVCPFRCSRIAERYGSGLPATWGAAVVHRSLGGLQPARPIAVTIARARLCPVLVVVPADRVPRLRLQRLLDDQPRRQLDQLLASRIRPGALDHVRKRLARPLDAGTLFAMGCLLAGSSTSRLHPSPISSNPMPSPGSRASSRARCSTSRTRAARGSSPNTSAVWPRSRRCGLGTAATQKQVDQLIAQSAAVRDAQLSQLRAKEVEAAEKVRAANERVVATVEAEREALVQTERQRFVAQALTRLSAEATAEQRREVEQLAGALVRRAAGAPGPAAAHGRGPLGHRPDPDRDRAARRRGRQAERAASSGCDRSGFLRPCGGGRE